jgi:hypothetical protein
MNAAQPFSFDWIWSIMWTLLRISGFFVAAPFWGHRAIPTATGVSIRETLQMVRDAFGADAVILDTRVEEGGARRPGLPRGGVVITVAAEPQRAHIPANEGPRTLRLKGTLGQITAEGPSLPVVPAVSATPATFAVPEIQPPLPSAGAAPGQLELAIRELRQITDDLRAVTPDGEIDPFSATDIQAGITDHVMRAIGSPDGRIAWKEDA